MKIPTDQALKQGAEAFAAGKLKSADLLWTAALKAAPDNPLANYSMGALAASIGALKEAEPLLDKAVTASPQHPPFWFKYLDVLTRTNQRKKVDKALASASAAIDPKVLEEIKQKTQDNRKQQAKLEAQAIGELRSLLAKNEHETVIRNGAVALETMSPGATEILFLMGVANASLRRFEESIYCSQRVIAIDPNHQRAYYTLGSVLIEIRELEMAEEVLGKALSLWPKDPRPHVLMGNIYRLRNHQTLAIECYEKALQANPNHAQALSNIGTCLSDLGDSEGAKQHYLQALESNPEFARAHRQLAWLHRYRGDEKQLIAMRNLFEKNTLPPADQVELGFGLSKAHQDLGDKEKAIDYLLQANREQKNIQNYSLDSDRGLYRRIREMAEVKPPEGIENLVSDHESIFVVGMPRSGTTLVEQILASHSMVHAGGELGALLAGIRKLGLMNGKPVPEQIAMLRTYYYNELAKLNAETRFITDKTPLNLRWLDLVFKMSPNAKVIHVQRDARAVCWSCLNHFFPAGGYRFIYDPKDLVAYFRMYRELMDTWREKYPVGIYDLSYEALISEQETEIRKLLEYAQLPWEESILNFHESDNAVRTSSSQQVRQPIYSGSSDKWRDYEPYLKEMFNELESYSTS